MPPRKNKIGCLLSELPLDRIDPVTYYRRHELTMRPRIRPTACYTVNRVETYLFYSRDRRRVLLGRTCDTNIQTRDAISRHPRVW